MMVKIAVLLAFASMIAAKSVDDKPLDRGEVTTCRFNCHIKENSIMHLDQAIDLCLKGEEDTLCWAIEAFNK